MSDSASLFGEDAQDRTRSDEALYLELDGWEGPLDLLLDLARRQKVDLRSISILALVDQYLTYIDEAEALKLASRIAAGPRFANMMTKTMLLQEWDMGLERAIEAEAQAQAICMQTEDFRRAYRAFMTREKPVFEGD